MVGMEDLALIVKRLEIVTEKLEAVGDNVGAGQNGVSQAEKLNVSVTAFDDICNGVFKAFLENCGKVGGEVQTAALILDKAFKAQREFLRIVSKSQQPNPTSLGELLKPTGDCIDEIQAYREKMRRCDFFNHLSALSEAVSALGWVTISPAPAPFVQEMNHAGQFYTNRVLKDWKEKNHVHVEWVKSWLQTLTELQAYVKQFHTTGLVWNKSGEDALIVAKQTPGSASAAPPPPPPPGPPAPPPPPPADLTTSAAVPPAKSARAELLDSLNQGNDITSNLRKVTDEEKTHKNPALRSDGLLKSAENGSSPASKAPGQQSKQPARTELEGKRWNVEFHKNNKEISVEVTELQHSVYVYKCEGCTIMVSGKCSSIVLDQCKKTGIVFDSVVAGMEIINCQSVQVQVMGTTPTISVDKTDGCQMFLSGDSLGVNIISSKCSEMNVMIPTAEEFVEVPVPEQFRTTITGTSLQTVPTEHNTDFI